MHRLHVPWPYGKRPSAAQIIRAWTLAGKPPHFSVEIGEAYAEFERQPEGWYTHGNGLRGLNRDSILSLLPHPEVD